MNNFCKCCGERIRIAINQGGDYCSELCRKVLAGEIPITEKKED